MSSVQTALDVPGLEGLIGQVRGVLAVRIVLGGDQQIDEIHVVGSPDRVAKQIVRDIESALFVRGGVRVNHKKISLVQLQEAAIRPTVERVRLVKIGSPDGGCAVTLAIGDREVTGELAVPAGGADELLVAQAAIAAIEQLITVPSRLRVDHVQMQALGRSQICLALLTRSEDDLTEQMLGVSILRDDGPTAVVRAVLDAVNRRLPYLMGRG